MLCSGEELVASGVNVVYLAELGHPSEPWSRMVVRDSDLKREESSQNEKYECQINRFKT